MAQGFKKLCTFSDLHLGRRGDDRTHNQHCLEFVEWFRDQCIKHNPDVIAFLGDWHDNMTRVGSETLNYSVQCLKILSDLDIPYYHLIGNHDILYRSMRDIHSLPFAYDIKNINIITEPITLGDAAFVPWLVESDNKSQISALNTRYIFGHFEFPHFLMNGGYEMPEKEQSLLIDQFNTNTEWIFSGHFHGRQSKKNKNGSHIDYIGNAFPLDFSDEGDMNRGMMVFEHGGKPKYFNWPDAPSYHKIKLSELSEAESKFGPRATLKIIQDVVTSESDRLEIKEELERSGSAMKVIIDPPKIDNSETKIKLDGLEISVAVETALNDENLELPLGVDRKKLIELYKQLGDQL